MYFITRALARGAPLTDLQIRRIEYTGALWHHTTLECPICHGATEALLTPGLDEHRAIRCLECEDPNPGPSPPYPADWIPSPSARTDQLRLFSMIVPLPKRVEG